MHDFLIIGVPLLVVGYITYSKVRDSIRVLERQIDALRLQQTKQREANRDLLSELQRLEARIEAGELAMSPQSAGDSVSTPFAAENSVSVTTDPKTAHEQIDSEIQEGLGLNRFGPDIPMPVHPPNVSKQELSGPPPLPDFLAELCDRLADESRQAETEPQNPDPQKPSIASGKRQEAHHSVFGSIPWRELLKRMHLLPPPRSESGGTAETQLAAWWVIRIGLVLLIIAAVFFGIHVSQKTPPWLRVVTLGFVAVGTIGLGARMRDRLEGFGRAIIGGGFALLYFTAFAAFALPATRIIDSAPLGALAQLSALIAAISWALWKKDQTVATLTVFLGLVSCGFSHSHDLDRFATVGLFMLACTGAFLIQRRGWLVPFITALIGAWIGFGTFAMLDGLRGDAPSFLQVMIALIALSVVFEAGGCFYKEQEDQLPSGRLRRWLLLGNTTATAVIGYAVVRMTHSEQLEWFYFATATLFFSFTAIHHFRESDRALTESFFLKSSALLCLGFASASSGPVRWLAIAFQAFSLLWTARRSGSRWIAAGFVIALAVSIGWLWRDLWLDPPILWAWIDRSRIAGSLYLVFLTFQLSLHLRWFPDGIGGTGVPHQNQARAFRLIGAFAIGLTALKISLTPSFPEHSDPAWFLLLVALLIGLVSPIMRSGYPCTGAALPLMASYVFYALMPTPTSQTLGALCLGGTLVGVAFCISELARRHWPASMTGAAWIREGILLTALATLLPLTHATEGRLSVAGEAVILLFTPFPLLACAAILCRHLKSRHAISTDGSFWFHSLAGWLVLAGGASTCHSSAFFPAVLALAGLPMLGLAAHYRIWAIVTTGAIPILGGFVTLWRDLCNSNNGSPLGDTINLVVLLTISVGIALFSWKRITASELRIPTLSIDFILHSLGILSIHLYLQKHLDEGADFLAAAVLGLTLYALSRRFPFRSLASASWLPITLACAWTIFATDRHSVANHEWIWVLAGFGVLLHLILAHRPASQEFTGLHGILTGTINGIAVVAWTLVALSAAHTPWESAALAGVGLLCAGLWRWKGIQWIGHLGLGPLILAFSNASAWMVKMEAIPGPDVATLASMLLTSAGISVNGMILASGVRRFQGSRITTTSVLPWFHAFAALIISFAVFTIDSLASDRFTAVFWGISAILVFGCGLLAGLRAYRLVGLIGLVFCIGHIFIFDIQDTFYRIIAFMVIGLVMLAVGFLYQRFRDRLSAMDD